MLPSQTDQGDHNTTAFEREPKHIHLTLHLHIAKNTTGIPATGEVLCTTGTTGGMAAAAAAWSPSLATGTDCQPTGRMLRYGIAVPHTHLKAVLGGIDRTHPGSEQGAMTFPALLHQIHPGMDHLVAQGAFRGFLRQGFQNGP